MKAYFKFPGDVSKNYRKIQSNQEKNLKSVKLSDNRAQEKKSRTALIEHARFFCKKFRCAPSKRLSLKIFADFSTNTFLKHSLFFSRIYDTG